MQAMDVQWQCWRTELYENTCLKELEAAGTPFVRTLALRFTLDLYIRCHCTFISAANAICGDLTFYSREDWEARDPVCQENMTIPVTYIFIHHTATSECSDFEECSVQMRAIQNLHMDDNGIRRFISIRS